VSIVEIAFGVYRACEREVELSVIVFGVISLGILLPLSSSMLPGDESPFTSDTSVDGTVKLLPDDPAVISPKFSVMSSEEQCGITLSPVGNRPSTGLSIRNRGEPALIEVLEKPLLGLSSVNGGISPPSSSSTNVPVSKSLTNGCDEVMLFVDTAAAPFSASVSSSVVLVTSALDKPLNSLLQAGIFLDEDDTIGDFMNVDVDESDRFQNIPGLFGGRTGGDFNTSEERP
jgi:hypothetical protein